MISFIFWFDFVNDHQMTSSRTLLHASHRNLISSAASEVFHLILGSISPVSWEVFHLILGSISPRFSVLLMSEWWWWGRWLQWRWRTWRRWWRKTWQWRWWQNLPPAVLLWSICLHHRLQGTRLDFGSRPFHFDQGFVVNLVERNSKEFLFLFGSFISTKRGKHILLCEHFWIWQMNPLC